jgi:hypothetical protein
MAMKNINTENLKIAIPVTVSLGLRSKIKELSSRYEISAAVIVRKFLVAGIESPEIERILLTGPVKLKEESE